MRTCAVSAAIIPVAEEAGVIPAAHPDDPPTSTLRNQPRLVNQPGLDQRLLDRKPSRSNALEFCLGRLAEMPDGSLHEAVGSFSRQGKIAYIHFRNVRGQAPHYWETFIDDGFSRPLGTRHGSAGFGIMSHYHSRDGN